MNFSSYSNIQKPQGGKREFKPLEAGVYKASVVGGEKRTSKSGNAYINLRLECRDKDENKKGTIFEMMFTDSDKNFLQYKAAQIGKAFGLDKVDKNMTDDEIINFLTGKNCTVVTTQSEFNGTVRAELDYQKYDGIYPASSFSDLFAMFYETTKEAAAPDMGFLNPTGDEEELPFTSESNDPLLNF